MRSVLTLDRLREALHYDPDSGDFTWRIRAASNTKVGRVAGTVNGHGYVQIRIDGVIHQAHRLAWLYVTGSWPHLFIDHINGETVDNRFSNLRVVPQSINQQNMRKARCDNKLGVLGVSPTKKGFLAQIHLGGKNHRIGEFPTVQQASDAYLEAKRRMHEGCTI